MFIYGIVSGGSAIILKKGIIRAGGIKLNNFFQDILPTTYNLLTTPMWFLGGIAALTGFFIYTIALNTYDVSIVKPLISTNLLFTFIFAAIIFRERLSVVEWFGVGVLVLGLLFFAFSPNIASTNDMNILLLIGFFPITIALVGLMIILIFVLKRIGSAEFVFPLFAGIFFGFGTFFTKSLLIGMNGSLQTLLSDDLLVIYSLVMLIVTYGFATVSQQLAFEKGRLSIVSPITNAVSVTISFIGAYFVFYEELIPSFSGLVTLQSFFKLIGLICIILALVLLRREVNPSSDHTASI
jgi:uncharacterized membrane protein